MEKTNKTIRTALITGATSGIGRATAVRLAEDGYRLILTGRREEKLLEVHNDLSEKFGSEVHCIVLDVRNNQDVVDQIANLPKAFKNIDILVNNAGLALGLNEIDLGEIEHWDTMIDTNIKGLLYMTKALLPTLKLSQDAHIINIGSIAGLQVYPKGNVYSATKHAVAALSRSMRIDLLPHHIKVTAIHPGMVETEFSRVRFLGDDERANEVYKGFEPLIGADVAQVISFALSLPTHSCINELEVTATAQGSSRDVIKEF
ncbi:MAG: SDR family NAD(P)-dependent oxidoreductase [Bacteroidota bacterium]|nr:SDR family NAD(P)-dependent oxidoreductase [Bacteroidota bacterium]